MADLHPIETAPQDGTWIIGIDKDGREARIQSRVTHPMLPDLRHWAEGEEVREGNWTRSKCFYPVAWKAIAKATGADQ